MITALSDWRAVVTDKLPERTGRCVVGWDLGGSASMTASAILFLPDSEGDPLRLEVFGAFADTPSLGERSKADSEDYEAMERAGELAVFSGRVTPASQFIGDIASRLSNVQVVAVGADRFRKSEAVQALEAAGVRWPIEWRGQGASATADGSHDVRCFQRLVLSRRLCIGESLLMASAVKNSVLRYDPLGNPALSKAASKARIDVLSAAVIAAGLAEALPVATEATRRARSGHHSIDVTPPSKMSRHHQSLDARRWRFIRLRTFQRDEWKCTRCDQRPTQGNELECHHVIALDKGGAPYSLDNLKTLCKRCHIQSHSSIDEERRKWIEYVRDLTFKRNCDKM